VIKINNSHKQKKKKEPAIRLGLSQKNSFRKLFADNQNNLWLVPIAAGINFLRRLLRNSNSFSREKLLPI